MQGRIIALRTVATVDLAHSVLFSIGIWFAVRILINTASTSIPNRVASISQEASDQAHLLGAIMLCVLAVGGAILFGTKGYALWNGKWLNYSRAVSWVTMLIIPTGTITGIATLILIGIVPRPNEAASS